MKRLLLILSMLPVCRLGWSEERTPSVAFSAEVERLSGENQIESGSSFARQPSQETETVLRIDLDIPVGTKTSLFASAAAIDRVRTLSERPGSVYGHRNELSGSEYKVGIKFDLK